MQTYVNQNSIDLVYEKTFASSILIKIFLLKEYKVDVRLLK